MKRKLLCTKIGLTIILCLMMTMQCTSVFARSQGGHHDGPPPGWSHHDPHHGYHHYPPPPHHRYYYRDGRFYRSFWFGFPEFSVSILPVGAFITVLPRGHRVMVLGGATYYYYDNMYFTNCPSGYVVVPAPVANPPVVIVPQSQGLSGETVIINVPNTNGSYTPVTLTKKNDGYTGPQGEYYPEHPTVEQLKALYGK